MAVEDAAGVALATFPDVPVDTPDGVHPLPVVMVAIAGAESSWEPTCAGDPGLAGPGCDGQAQGHPVRDATSWGLWQVHNVHGPYLMGATGSADPCDWARWLYDPANNARAALHVLGPHPQHGLGNWTTWRTGRYRRFLAEATPAVARARALSGRHTP